MAEKTYGTPIQEVEIDGVYHKVEGSGSGGITEISDDHIRITSLASGVYKLTYSGTKYIYYSGESGTSTHTVTGGSGAVILTVNRHSTTYWHWYYINGTTGYETIYYGYTSSSSGSTGSKALNSLLTSHQTMYYRPIQVNGTQILANTSSTALNLSNDGNVKFAQVSGGKIKAEISTDTVVAVLDSSQVYLLYSGNQGQFKLYSWYDVSGSKLQLVLYNSDDDTENVYNLTGHGSGTFLIDCRTWGIYVSFPDGTKQSYSGTSNYDVIIRAGSTKTYVYKLI